MLDALFIMLLVLSLPFPIGYAFYKKLDNKLLFIFAAYGAESVIGVLLMGMSAPILLLNTYMFPQLEAAGYSENISWLLNGIYVVEEYWYLFMPIALFLFPVFLRRSYKPVFEVNNTHNNAN